MRQNLARATITRTMTVALLPTKQKSRRDDDSSDRHPLKIIGSSSSILFATERSGSGCCACGELRLLAWEAGDELAAGTGRSNIIGTLLLGHFCSCSERKVLLFDITRYLKTRLSPARERGIVNLYARVYVSFIGRPSPRPAQRVVSSHAAFDTKEENRARLLERAEKKYVTQPTAFPDGGTVGHVFSFSFRR